MVESTDMSDDFKGVISDHKIKDYECLLIDEIVNRYWPVKYMIGLKQNFFILEVETQYQHIVEAYKESPEFPELLYHMHLNTFIYFMELEAEHGLLVKRGVSSKAKK
tara:strand:+ start:17551 stop:17871 length:321 start_codon:yes stop_codon:yes gene_type:complete